MPPLAAPPRQLEGCDMAALRARAVATVLRALADLGDTPTPATLVAAAELAERASLDSWIAEQRRLAKEEL